MFLGIRIQPVKPGLKTQPGWRGVVFLLALWMLGIGLGLGTAARLTYHEAFVAQGAREIVASGHWWHPTIGGLPWLEKPPLPFWLVAVAGLVCWRDHTSLWRGFPLRLPHWGWRWGLDCSRPASTDPRVGILTAAVQITTAWTILRGRLAEADILLACLITWTLLAFDRLRAAPGSNQQGQDVAYVARWLASLAMGFLWPTGRTSLVKGTGFGAVLVLSVVGFRPLLGS